MDRRLDIVEAIFALYHRFDAWQTAHALLFRGPATGLVAREALRRLQERKPRLRWRLEGDGETARFVTTEAPLPLSFAVAEKPDTFRAAIEQAINSRLDERAGLLWRAEFLQAPDPDGLHALVVVAHHSLLDGVGAAQLLVDWLAGMVRVLRGEPAEASAEAPAPPVMELLQRPSLSERAAYRVRRLAGYLRGAPVPYGIFESSAAASERSTGVMTDSVPVANLRARARVEGTTVQGAFQAAIVAAVREVFGLRGPLTVSTPVNLRAHLEPPLPRDALGCYVASVETVDREVGTMQFWERAREARRELSRTLAQKEWRMAFRATEKRIGALQRRLEALAADDERQGRIHFLTLSNLGEFATADASPFSVEGLYEATANHGVGNTLAFAATSVAGQLCFSLLYVKPLVGEARARRVLERTRTLLLAAAQTR